MLPEGIRIDTWRAHPGSMKSRDKAIWTRILFISGLFLAVMWPFVLNPDPQSNASGTDGAGMALGYTYILTAIWVVFAVGFAAILLIDRLRPRKAAQPMSSDPPWPRNGERVNLMLRQFVASGPVDEIEFLDEEWQGAPVWRATDTWVATEAPDLAYAGPPWPGLLIAARIPVGESLTVSVSDRPPLWMHQVFASELTVGDHGFFVAAGEGHMTVPVQAGNYPVAVWVDGDTPDATGHYCIVLGAPMRRRLGRPRT
jgi:hypothetical protein